MTRTRIGVGGWTFEPWRGTFYPAGLPQKRELEFASRKLSSIEINGTYYRLQKPATFAQWRNETPDDFIFALKGSRFVTNRRVLAEAGAALDRFFASGLTELQDKLGPINWQFMPTKKFDPEDLEAFLSLLPKSVDGRRIRHALEVRHESFMTSAFIELAARHGVAVVIAGDSEYPMIADVTADFVYVRIMGTRADQPGGYAPAALDRWGERLRLWAVGGVPNDLPLLGKPLASPKRDVFLYVISGHKPVNPDVAVALLERLR